MSSDNDRPLYTRRRVIGLGAAALGAAAAGRVIPAYGAQGSAIDSYNWSGARVTKDVLSVLYPNPPNQFFTSVKATWRVPKVQLHQADKESHSATWIGLDGGTWGLIDTPPVVKVLQAGTYHDVYLSSTGKPVATYFAFFGLDEGNPAETNLYPKFQRPLFVVNPTDEITVLLEYTPGSHTANATFTSASQSAQYSIPSIPDGSITGYTVEWVLERISLNNDSSFKKDYYKAYRSLGNHDAVVFKNAEAMTDQGYSVSPDDGDSINMRDVDDWPTLLTGAAALSWGSAN